MTSQSIAKSLFGSFHFKFLYHKRRVYCLQQVLETEMFLFYRYKSNIGDHSKPSSKCRPIFLYINCTQKTRHYTFLDIKV